MAFVPGDSIFQLHEDNQLPSSSPHVLSSSRTPQDFQGFSTLMMTRSMSFSGVDQRCEETRMDDDMSDDGYVLGEKKRRLNMEQVKALEKNFELGNKLEPERKMQLARDLGLQPRQIAIWFQNRRARWKTKQLEKDYDILKKQFEAVEADNDALKSQNRKLQSELRELKHREATGVGAINLNKENEGSWSNGSEKSIDVNLGATATASATNSPPYPHHDQYPSNKNGFSSTIAPPTSLTQFLHGPSRVLDLQSCPKIYQMTVVQDESCSHMFNGIEEQPNFWPWPEQQQHFH